MGPSNSSYLSNIAIFHFHDYGGKSNAPLNLIDTLIVLDAMLGAAMFSLMAFFSQPREKKNANANQLGNHVSPNVQGEHDKHIIHILVFDHLVFRGKFWVPLGDPSSCSPNIATYCPLQPLYNPYYWWYMLVYISGTLPRVPNFSLWCLEFLVLGMYSAFDPLLFWLEGPSLWTPKWRSIWRICNGPKRTWTIRHESGFCFWYTSPKKTWIDLIHGSWDTSIWRTVCF